MLVLKETDGFVEIEVEAHLFRNDIVVYYGKSPEEALEKKNIIDTFSRGSIRFVRPEFEGRMYYVLSDGNHSYMTSHRVINLDGTANTRDFGGYPGLDGKFVKWGVFYRSDALNKLSEEDITILESLKIQTVVDFRTEREVTSGPDKIIQGVQYFNFSPNAEVAQLASGNIQDDKTKVEELVGKVSTEEGRKSLAKKLDDMEIQMREMVNDKVANQAFGSFMNLLVEQSNVPILHHCKGGKDRTGFASAIVLLALGVDKKWVMQDYMMTKELTGNRNEKRMQEYRQYTDNEVVLNYLSSLMQAQESYLEAIFDEIERLSSNIEKYLEDYLDFTEVKLRKLREYYLY